MRTGRPIHLFVLLFFLNSGVFANSYAIERPLGFEQGKQKEYLTGQSPSEMERNPWPDDGGKPSRGEWHFGRGVFMAVRFQVPILPILAESDWVPADRPMRLLRFVSYEEWAALTTVVNLILIPLIVVGLRQAIKQEGY